jgi:hypothetical protein
MVEGKKPGKKRGRKKGTRTKEKTNNNVMISPQEMYNVLIEMRKQVDKKIKVHIKYCKDMGFKLSKRSGKSKDEIKGKTKGKPGRKKKAAVVTEGKSE